MCYDNCNYKPPTILSNPIFICQDTHTYIYFFTGLHLISLLLPSNGLGIDFLLCHTYMLWCCIYKFIKISRSHSDFHAHRLSVGFLFFWVCVCFVFSFFLACGTKGKKSKHYGHILPVNICIKWYGRCNTSGGRNEVFSAGLPWRALSWQRKNKWITESILIQTHTFKCTDSSNKYS